MIKNLKRQKKKGFTLVELIVVIAIIGILAGISVPKYSAYKQSANKRVDEATARLITNAVLIAADSGEFNLSKGLKINENSGDDNWTAVEAYISDTTMRYETAKKWKIFIHGDTIQVYAGVVGENPSDTHYNDAIIKKSLEY